MFGKVNIIVMRVIDAAELGRVSKFDELALSVWNITPIYFFLQTEENCPSALWKKITEN